MRPFHGLPCNLLAFLITTQVLPVFAQEAPKAPSEPASAPAAAPASAPAAPAAAPQSGTTMEKVMVYGDAIGVRQTRANVKITAADLDYYPPGVSADKVLERVSGIQTGSSNAFGGDGFESTINMRGFAKDSIGFSIDGIPNGRTTLGGGSVPTRYFDSSNLAGVDVSQSAGVVGSPSHQALAGQVNYLTLDPSRRFGFHAEAAGGSAEFGRVFARVDSGELLPGLTSYLSVSRQQWAVSYVDDPAGKNERDHVDLKAVLKLDGGAVVKLHSSYNNRKEESGTNIVTLKQFNTNPKNDLYTDTWSGTSVANDRNYRELKGNPRKDVLTYLDGEFPLTDKLKLTAKGYYQTQTGIGKETGLGNAVPGLDGSTNSIYFRANEYDMIRRGVLGELAGKQSDLIDWRVGAWYERSNRGQVRNWYPLLDQASGPAYSDVASTTSEDKHWDNQIAMVYAANRSSFLDGRLKFDYGVTYLDNNVDYDAPIHDSRRTTADPAGRFNYVNEAKVNSGVLPKVGTVYSLSDTTEVFAGYAKNAASVTDATLEGGSKASLAAAQTVNKMDTANAFDLGLRQKGENYAAGVQAFVIDSKETVAADIVGTLQSENVDQGRRIHGVEATYNGRLGDSWRLYGAYTYQKGEYKLSNVNANGNPDRGFIRDGAELVGIAPHNLFLETTWRPMDDLKLAVNGRYVSSRAGYYANPRVGPPTDVDERLPGYALFGLNTSYSFSRVSVGLNVENITDKKYISGIAPELMTSPSTVGRYFIGAPRTIVLWAKLDI
jgi:iron complex outermembrane receptor protein